MRRPKISVVLLWALEFLIIIQSSLSQFGPQDFVDAHNFYRTAEGLPPYKWDEPFLATYARKYVNVRSQDCKLEHSAGPYGESIYEGGGNDTARMVVDDWAGEKKFWNPKTKKCVDGEECGHYLQVVDPNAVIIGCARAKCKNDDYYWFVLCNYNGPGWNGPGWTGGPVKPPPGQS